jgi:NAD(P)-dependent dehydrogenase (short-subunit alcohol dehydrogenase family)
MSNKVWLVTGSSRGLGRDLALAIVAAGDELVATARNTEDLAELAKAGGERVRTFALDVTDEGAARAAVAAAIDAFGRLDVVVNNAGYANVDSFEDLPAADFRAQVETNFFGVVNVTRAALPILRKQRSGHIVQIASVGARIGSPGLTAYQAAKFAVGGFTEALSQEVAPFGVKVTCVEPGGMRTDWGGSSMKIYDTKPDYQPSVGWFVEQVRKNADVGRSDPKKCAQAILRLVALEKPPVRLLLGGDATFFADLAGKRRSAEDQAHRALSESTDYDGLPPFADTPLGKMLSGR